METVVCANCGKEFQRESYKLKNAKIVFCGQKCTQEYRVGPKNPSWKNKTKTFICDYCGISYQTRDCNINGKNHYCSYECKNNARRSRPLVKCDHCGKEFRWKRATKGLKSHYCSQECYFNARRANGIVECDCCGKAIHKPPYALKHYGHHYCSRACWTKAADSMENHPMWKGGISFEPYCVAFTRKLKEEVREAFGRKCFLCGVPENGKKHAVHHVDYNKSQGCSGMRWSLIPLCSKCHSKTNHNRWHWFALLRDYWIYEYINEYNQLGGGML